MFPPIEELKALRGAPIMIPKTTVKSQGHFNLTAVTGSLDQMEISLNITADWTKSSVSAGISVMGGVPITLKSLPKTEAANPEGVDLLQLNCGGKVGQSVIGPSTSTVNLRVFLDKSSIEAYAAGGRGVASHRVYPTAEELKQGMALLNDGSAEVTISGMAWPMAEAARPSVEDMLN
jgi:sucrose-6-phosphate hydrolase SacC (GH32 family)